ncbi:LytTR family DNA-binding domain-containing protein [Flavihumibacter sp. RY-1]|uniref:LytTR family DNA-binding domain-containing protein n=1 Tax=Flavihumibacter fluminis TaxID=2909236 RepID=A0ABS9BMD9_9BACT|nr:LytTR family DNA-binding domain-containing protein [Flavihumibacter fluminis]MCF1716810.1 LytTR family DNA-binding domain-containing protein [Flavihumibacter fluminis]
MEKYSCIIVEDEPLAAEVLTDYIRQTPFLELKGICSDAIYALELLQRQPIDLIFLDIHLPKLRGYDFIRTLKNQPQIIITTAYREYALEGYELNVVDYLLKPISFNRFLSAINKVRKNIDPVLTQLARQPVGELEAPYILINVNKKRVKIELSEILYIESKKEYISIVTRQQAYLTKYALGDIDQQLDKARFLRIHRSFIVARDKIKAFNATEVEINGIQLPIGRSYKELVLSLLGDPLL